MYKIAVIGWRNFLSVNDAITEHCKEVYRRLVERGWEFIIFVKKGTSPEPRYKGVELINIFTPKLKSLETPVYVILSFLWLIFHRSKKYTLVHIHTIGCGFVIPLLKLFGYKVVVTHHGPDYVRSKWNFVERLVLKLCELIVVNYADELLAISVWVKYFVEQKYNRPVTCTPNGIGVRGRTLSRKYINKIDVVPFKYFLSVGNFVPEKGFKEIVESFQSVEEKHGWKLVLAGNVEPSQKKYYKQILKIVKNDRNIIIIENPTEEMLQELFCNAGVYISGSSYESAPTYLILAMSYNLPVIATSIESNVVVGKEYPYYFPQGNIFALKYYMTKIVNNEIRFNIFNRDLIRDYNWESITDTIEDVYRRAVLS